jgi:hypothetical protein
MANKPEGDPEQYKRFLEKVKELEDAGELSHTEADEAFERAIKRVIHPSEGSPSE